MKLIAVLRLAVPYTGIILSTRESPEMRSDALRLGVSQISEESRTEPGDYNRSRHTKADTQFQMAVHCPVDEVISILLRQGYLPSFCTSCYRRGRTGKDFVDLAKSGLIKQHCLPNAVLTLKEYLEDFGSVETWRLGNKVIHQQMDDISTEKRRMETEMRLERIENGERDLFF